MKNKYKALCLYIFLFLFFSNNIVNSDQSFVYEAQQIEILDSIIQHPSNDVEEDYRLICYNLSSEQLDSVGW